jgi:hypothetical protein
MDAPSFQVFKESASEADPTTSEFTSTTPVSKPLWQMGDRGLHNFFTFLMPGDRDALWG